MKEEIMDTPEVPQEGPQESYKPRPGWQVWLARVGVAIMIVSFFLYLMHIASGGAV